MKINIKKYCPFCLFFLLFIILISNIFLITNEHKKISITYNNENKNTLDYISYLKNKYNNNDIVGYLKINDDIASPLVQTTNNTYYLNHSFNKESLITGNTFIDYRNNIEKDKNIIIYGHNSDKYNIPFKYLKNYLEYDYFINNKNIYITFDKTYTYEIFSVFIVNNDYKYNKVYFKDLEYVNHLEYLKNKSIYKYDKPLNENDYIITIQTCMNDKLGSLLIINGKKV